MRILNSVSTSLAAFGFILGCLGGLSGCDSKPADGTVVQEGPQMSDEQKQKVMKYRADSRPKTAEKTPRKN
jgi:hypothetical protein